MTPSDESVFERPRRRVRVCRCGAPNEVQIVVQARKKDRTGTLATRGRTLCKRCAEDVFEAMEQELLASPPPGARS